MLNKIINFSLRNKLLVIIGVLFLVMFGSYQLTQLPIDAVPDITNNQVQVITQSPSLGAPDIERLITFPIEQALSNIPGKVEIRSFSRFGLSLVTVVFTDETDVYWARQQVTERLTQVQSQIPQGLGTPELGPVTTGLGEIYQYVLRPKKGYEEQYTPTELRTIQDWIVRRQLLNVKGVADVSSFGGFLKQVEVSVDAARLSAHEVTLNQVYEALNNNNQNEGGAYIERGPNVYFIRTEGLINSPDEIKKIPLPGTQGGTPLYVGDVATVTYSHATRYGAMVYNNEAEVAGAVLMMLKGANSNAVIHDVKERIEQIKSTLPEGVELEAFLDRTKMVNNAISTVETNLLEGALIVIFVLVLFLGNMRAGLLVASVIPLAMLFAVTMMNAFGVSGNLMSLGALDFGLIVDGAVIIVEAVMHLLTHNKRFLKLDTLSSKVMDEQVGAASAKMMNAAVFGQLIILIVYLPIFSLQGIEGKMFKPMAQTVSFALLGAFILSLTYIPVMSALLLKNISHEPNFADRFMLKAEAWYTRMLLKVFAIKKYLVMAVLIVFTLSIYLLTTLGGEFIPSLEEGDFAVETRVLTGSNLKVSVQAAQQSAALLLKEYPEVEKIVTKIGSGEIPTDPMPIEAMDMMVILKPKDSWTSAKSFPELADKMSESLEAVPGVSFGFQYPVQMRFNELMTGARQDVVCKIFGENLDTLAKLGHRLGEIASGIEGAKDIYVESILGMPQVVINYRREVLAQYGLQINDVNDMVNAAFAGKKAGMLFEAERRFDLVVRLSEDNRKRIEDISGLLIPLNSGGFIPLGQLAEVKLINGPNQIQREEARRRMIVGFNVRGNDVQTVVQELMAKIKSEVKLPPGYYVSYGGSFKNLEEARARLSIAVPIALLLIFLLLYFAFHSVKDGLLIYSAIPLSAMGGIFALALRGMPFSISAGIGFIALFGVAVLNGIVLVTEFRHQLKTHPDYSVMDAIIKGASLRLRPVLMTATVASLGFLPMALSNGSGAEVQRPLATVVIGGLLVATFLTLMVLPALYLLFHKTTPNKSLAMILLGLLSLGMVQQSQAQVSITLQKAKEMLVQNNASLEAVRLKTAYAKKLSGSAWQIQQTNLSYEQGQINSAYADNRINISQSFDFPTIYLRQKNVLKGDWKIAEANGLLQTTELMAELEFTFTQLQRLLALEGLLKKTDTEMQNLENLAALRLKAGESNSLEQAALLQARAEALYQLNQLLADKQMYQLRLQLLLGSDSTFIPEGNNRIGALPQDSLAVENHPEYLILMNKTLQSKQVYRLEKARLLPQINLGYSNMSITGVGNDNIYYPPSTRFQSVQAGIGVPLFFGSNQSRISAAKLNLRASEQEASYKKQALINNYKQLLNKARLQENLLQYYEQKVMPGAKLVQENAGKQLAAGQINYLEWMLLYQQSLQSQTRYYNELQEYNNTLIELNKFKSELK